MSEDEQHLRWLSISHYVLGTFSALFYLLAGAAFGFITFAMSRPEIFTNGGRGNPPPKAFVVFWIAMMSFTFLWWGCQLVGTFLAGYFLALRKHYVFCFILAALDCMRFPFGTVVGVFTIIVLSRPSVKALFTQNLQTAPSTGPGMAAPA